VLLKLKNRQELGPEYDKDRALEKKYEEQLTEADVATLSRAQRRARTRQIMKQQRRATRGGGGGVAEQHPGEDMAQPLALAAEREHLHVNDDDDDDDQHLLLSRKERQKLAKATEREERKLLQDERQRQQALAMEQARQRKMERLQNQAMQEELAKRQQLQKQQEAARARQKAWEIFLSKHHRSIGNERQQVTVDEWVQEYQKRQIVSLSDTAHEFGVSTDAVRDRIQTLVEERRVAGVFMKAKKEEEDDDVFVMYSNEQLEALASLVKSKGLVSKNDVADWMSAQIRLGEYT